MKNKSTFLLLVMAFFILSSCQPSNPNENIDTGKIENNYYTDEATGWTIKIPDGWKVTSREKRAETFNKGKELLEETMQEEIDLSQFESLISIQKDQYNSFEATREYFELTYDGEWEDNNTFVKQILSETFTNQGISFDSTETQIEMIDGLPFEKYSFTLYTPEGKVALRQIMYSCHINNYDFGATINYTKDKNRDELLEAFRNSKFTQE